MTAKILGNSVQNCVVGISVPKDADVEIGFNTFVSCQQAIELRDPPSLIQALGLRSETPPEAVRELTELLAKSSDLDAKALEERAKPLGLLSWLAAGSDVTTLTGAIYQLHQSGLVQAAIALLSR